MVASATTTSKSLEYLARGLSIVPIKSGTKRPAVRWERYQHERPDLDTVADWARRYDTYGIVAGKVSGKLLILDFESLDVYTAWLDLIPDMALDTCPIASTPRGGRHVYLRLDHAPPANEKLAMSAVGDTLIETRGEGGQCVAPPAEGREWVQRGWLDGAPVEPMGRELLAELLAAARFLDEQHQIDDEPPASPGMFAGKAPGGSSDDVKPGDDFNARTDADGIVALLEQHGWTRASTRGGTIHVTRPGKDTRHGISGTIGHRRTPAGYPLFITFSTNAAPFEATTKDRPRGYTAFSVYALLNHGGDFSAAAKALAARGYGSPQRQTGTSGATSSSGPADGSKLPRRWTIGELQDAYPTMRPPVLDGLVREAETLNIIAPTKIGKSWLSYSLLLSIVTGKPWFGRFPTAQGKVLLIDNELHPETIAQRLRFVANALGIARDEYRDLIELYSLRGGLLDINAIHELIDPIQPYEFRLLLVDAKYRMLPVGTSENANEDETHFYNRVDQYAEATRAVWSNVHHSTKGNQSGKSVTDTGAGGGAQSRAADCHLVLREHEQDGVFVLEAAVRSFAPVEPLALRWQFPLWIPADDVDPSALRGRLNAQEAKQRAKDQEAQAKIAEAIKAARMLTERGVRNATGFSKDRTERLLTMMLADGRIRTVADGEDGATSTLYRMSD